MTTPITSFPITGFAITDLALVSPAAGQFLEVGGADDGRVDIDDLAGYVRAGVTWATVSGTAPTTIAGYGITDGITQDDLDNYQPLDADLTAYAALSTTGLVERTGAGTVATVPVTAFAKGLLDDADAATARTTLGLVIGTNVQAWSTRLDSVAGLSATSGVVEKTGANTFGTFTISSFAKTYLDETSQLNTQIVLGVVPGADVQPYSARLLAVAGIAATSGTIEKTGADTFGTYTVSTFAKSYLFQTTAAAVRGTLAAAAADHTHPYDAAISLTPQNSFTTFGGGLYENSLTVYPALKLAVLRFALSRTSIPASETVALTWSSAYATNRGIIAINPGCNLTAQTATPLVLGYVQGNELKFNYPRTESATAIAYLVGSITFTYA